MIGVSGPSISISDIVDPETRERGQKVLDGADAGARGVAKRGAERGLRHIAALGLEQPLASAWQSGAQEHHAGVGVGRMKDDLSRRRRVYADTVDGRTVAQRCLKPKPHLQRHPDLRPALDLRRRPRCEALKLHTASLSKAADRRPPPAATKKSGDGS